MPSPPSKRRPRRRRPVLFPASGIGTAGAPRPAWPGPRPAATSPSMTRGRSSCSRSAIATGSSCASGAARHRTSCSTIRRCPRRHAVMIHRDGRAVLLDDRSLNGIFVNGDACRRGGAHRRRRDRHRARELAVRRGHRRLSRPGRRRYRPAPHDPGPGLPRRPGPGISFPWPKSHGHLSAGDAGELVGVTGNTIGQWARWGYIRASQSSGDPHVYSVEDVAEAAVVRALLDRKVRHRHRPARDRAPRRLRPVAAQPGAARHDPRRPPRPAEGERRRVRAVSRAAGS